jgi:hypothetical protein
LAKLKDGIYRRGISSALQRWSHSKKSVQIDLFPEGLFGYEKILSSNDHLKAIESDDEG